MGCVFAGDFIAAPWKELGMHTAELFEVLFELEVLVSLASRDDTDHILHDLGK